MRTSWINKNSDFLGGDFVKKENKHSAYVKLEKRTLFIDEEYNNIMNHYNDNLEELANYHDSMIVHGYTKILAEEKKQMDMYKHIYFLLKEENEAKKKLDNLKDSGDQIFDKNIIENLKQFWNKRLQ